MSHSSTDASQDRAAFSAYYVDWLVSHRDALIQSYADVCAQHDDERSTEIRQRTGTTITDVFIASGTDDHTLRTLTDERIARAVPEGLTHASSVTQAARFYHRAVIEVLDKDTLEADLKQQLSRHLQHALLSTNEAILSGPIDIVETQRVHAEALLDMEHKAARAEDADGLLEAILTPLRTFGDVSATLWYQEHDAKGGVSQQLAAASAGDPLALALDDTALSKTPFETSDMVLIDSLQEATPLLSEALRVSFAMAGVSALASVPLTHQGQREGTLVFGWSTPHPFDEDEQVLLKAIARTLAPLVAHRRLLEALERRVADRTEEVRAKLGIIQRQSLLIQELSTPILQIWPGVLAMPIVGNIEGARSAQIMQAMLARLATTQARWLILDVTGVEQVDTHTANDLLKLVRAAGLIGAHCIMTGIRAVVAQTMVGLGVELTDVTTLRTLEAGLRYCIRQLEQDA